jgi:hypothetical protein
MENNRNSISGASALSNNTNGVEIKHRESSRIARKPMTIK